VITVPSHTKKDNPKAALKPRPRRQRRDRVPTSSFPATVDTYQAHPERFRGRCPQPKNLPAKVWINEPPATIETTPPPQTTQAA